MQQTGNYHLWFICMKY